ncbi:MAG: GNAT family N-acetyltransferase [Bacteroidales bacterium]|nr:GNAT family N-acetyltransferase [Bacteroidales bacterium]
MQEIIAPVDKSLLLEELKVAKLLRHARKGGTDIYIFTAQQCPNLMREVGRLREIAFREAGGGTGLDCDLDDFDLMEEPYWQLIVWDPKEEKILGGYRYIHGRNIRFDENGAPILATSHMFHFSDKFKKEYLPNMLELGRSFVVVENQSSRSGAKSLFTLDNLWDGLGALSIVEENTKYFFGKFTMYPSYPPMGRNMILYFLNKHFPDPDRLVWAYNPLETNTDIEAMEKLFVNDTFADDYKILNKEVRNLGFNIPPLVNAYMCLSPTMKIFGTAINDEFGDVEESGILITIDEIASEKHQRYIQTFLKEIED